MPLINEILFSKMDKKNFKTRYIFEGNIFPCIFRVAFIGSKSHKLTLICKSVLRIYLAI